jgi:putative transposase
MDCLAKNKASILAFYDYFAEYWQHIRTINPVESVFATVRLRTTKTINCDSRTTTRAMLFKLIETVQKNDFGQVTASC